MTAPTRDSCGVGMAIMLGLGLIVGVVIMGDVWIIQATGKVSATVFGVLSIAALTVCLFGLFSRLVGGRS